MIKKKHMEYSVVFCQLVQILVLETKEAFLYQISSAVKSSNCWLDDEKIGVEELDYWCSTEQKRV